MNIFAKNQRGEFVKYETATLECKNTTAIADKTLAKLIYSIRLVFSKISP